MPINQNKIRQNKTKLKIALAIISISLSCVSAPIHAQQYTDASLRYASPYPDNQPQGKLEQWWIAEIATATNNSVKIKGYWSGSMGNTTELPGLLKTGAVDIAGIVGGSNPSIFPITGGPNNLPMSFDTIEQVNKLQNELEITDDAKKELVNANVVPLWRHMLNPYKIICRKPIETIADFKGKKIRSYGNYQPLMWKALGAIPVNVYAPEVYEALNRGSIDCGYFANDLIDSYRLYEVAKYVSDINFGAMAGWSIMFNADSWAKLNKATQDAIIKISAEAQQKEIDQMNRLDKEASEKFEKLGITVVQFKEKEAMHKLVPDFVDLWVRDLVKSNVVTEHKGAKLAEMWKAVTASSQ